MATATKAKARTRTRTAKAADPVLVTVTLAQFDSFPHPHLSFEIVRRDVPIGEYAPLQAGDYSPRGGTPLRDATAQFIGLLDEIRAPDKVTIGVLRDRSGSMQGNEGAVIAGVNEFVAGMADVREVDAAAAGTVLCVIFTDGLENTSRETSPEALRQMVAEREKDGWTFIYLGANQDAWDEGSALGFSGGAHGHQVNFTSSPLGTANALRSVTHHAASYLEDNVAYASAAPSFSQRTVAEDGTETTAAGVTTPPPAHTHAPGAGQASGYDVASALRSAKEATEK